MFQKYSVSLPKPKTFTAMSTTAKLFSISETRADGTTAIGTLVLNSERVYYIATQAGTHSVIQYGDYGNAVVTTYASETAAAVAALTESMISVPVLTSDGVTTETVYLNPQYIVKMVADGSNTKIIYWKENMINREFTSTQPVTAIPANTNAINPYSPDAVPQSITGPGVIVATTQTTKVTTTGADAFTLEDPLFEGQLKIILFEQDGGDATITPTSVIGYTTITMDSAGDSVILYGTAAGDWYVVSNVGCVLA
jgi:hypothetical protein